MADRDSRWSIIDIVGGVLIATAIAAGGIAAAWSGFNSAFPAEYWYEFRAMDVLDTTAGQPVEIVIDREVRRSFTGSRLSTVRDVDGNPVCSGSYNLSYEEGEPLPNPVLLAWWTENTHPPCSDVAGRPGQYSLTTCTRIDHRLPFLPAREVCLSDVFTIHEPGEQASAFPRRL